MVDTRGTLLWDSDIVDGRGGMKAVFDGLPMEREPFILRLQSVKQFADGSVWMQYKVNQ